MNEDGHLIVLAHSADAYHPHQIIVPAHTKQDEAQTLCLTTEQMVDLYEQLSHFMSRTDLLEQGD